MVQYSVLYAFEKLLPLFIIIIAHVVFLSLNCESDWSASFLRVTFSGYICLRFCRLQKLLIV